MKKAWLIFGLICLGATFWFWGRPAYREHKESRALARAQSFLNTADYGNASLSARQALQLNATNLEACKIMARLAELAGAPQVLDWRRRVAQVSPTLENKLNLASTAIRLEAAPCPTAAETLAALDRSAKDCCAYHVISAELALKLNKPYAAEHHFLEACRLEPTNQLHELNLAVLRLRFPTPPATNALASSEANPTRRSPEESTLVKENLSFNPATEGAGTAEPRTVLERLRTNGPYAAVALRSLLGDAMLRNDLPDAERYSNQLLSQPQAVFEDELRHLSILRQKRSAQFQPFLQAAQDRTTSSAREVYSVASWMTANGMAAAGLIWVTNLPAKLQATMPVPLAIGDALVAQRDWPRLDEFLAGKNWEQLDFVRLAWLTRAAWEQKRTQAAEAHWRLALRPAEDRLGPLTWLLSMAKQSGQPPEQVLWRIVRKFPKERWAWLELHEFYAAAGSTSGLNLLYSELASCEPNNFVAKNNFAATSMLLRRNLAKAHETARELYAQNPGDSVIASTYAFSQHLQGRTRDGLAALEKCPTTALENPAVALYYGVLLAADGQTNRATKFLELAQTTTLLPEEKTLVRLAGTVPPRP